MSAGLTELLASIGSAAHDLDPEMQDRINGASTFTEAADVVVRFLNEKTPLSDWSVTRVVSNEQVFVHVEPGGERAVGDRVAWDQTFCKQMVAGGAHVVADASRDPVYAALGSAAGVGSYAGYTIIDDRGELFGVLCGTRNEPLQADESVDEELVLLLSRLLSIQLQLARGIDQERRHAAIAEALAKTDPLTGLLNRRGWERMVDDAQERIDAFGDPVSVAVVDLDDLKSINDGLGHQAGDAQIVGLANALTGAATASHRIARVGGDEFLILANGVAENTAEAHFERFIRAISASGIRASFGYATARAGDPHLEAAIHEADARMYAQKSSRK